MLKPTKCLAVYLNKPFKFSSENRLLTKKAFEFVFEKPCTSRSPFFTILYRQNNLKHSRLGVVVSKRKVRKAVNRNYIKRLVRESFRHHVLELSGLDFVVIAKGNVLKDKRKDARNSLDKQWKGIGGK